MAPCRVITAPIIIVFLPSFLFKDSNSALHHISDRITPNPSTHKSRNSPSINLTPKLKILIPTNPHYHGLSPLPVHPPPNRSHPPQRWLHRPPHQNILPPHLPSLSPRQAPKGRALMPLLRNVLPPRDARPRPPREARRASLRPHLRLPLPREPPRYCGGEMLHL